TIAGTLDRFAFAGGRVWFTLRERRGIFTIVDPNGPDVLLARAGDRVRFRVSPDGAGAQLVRDFADGSLAR
ncbi:MAG: hypothetical protein JWO85_2993, partial [Candidatus Eremiobacteraeota bacterium]|nr:hypothetical protein [Candidatus Eremiobacteraeota bacterium]